MKRLAISNFKGGVGKSTCCLNLAWELARRGRRVLLVDLDPQGNLSSVTRAPDGGSVGYIADHGRTVADIFIPHILGTVGTVAADVVYRTAWDGVDIVPANSALQDAVVPIVDSKHVVRFLLDDLEGRGYDVAIMDTRPDTVDIKTQCAWVAADRILVPVECNAFMMDSLSDTIERIKDLYDRERLGIPNIKAVLTKFDGGTVLGRQGAKAFELRLPDRMRMRSSVRRSVKVGESQTARCPVGEYVTAPSSVGWGARCDFSDLADEVAEWMGV